MDIDKALDIVQKNVNEHRTCKLEKNQILTTCEELAKKLSEELEKNNNNLKEVDTMMRVELNKVISEKDKIIKDQKSHYVSQNLDLLNKLNKLRKEYENLTIESSTKDKERKNANQQCEILGEILDNYKIDFRTMSEEISQLKNSVDQLIKDKDQLTKQTSEEISQLKNSVDQLIKDKDQLTKQTSEMAKQISDLTVRNGNLEVQVEDLKNKK